MHAQQLAPLGALVARLEPRHVRVLRVGRALACDQPGEHDAAAARARLNGQRRWNQRLWRPLVRASEAMAERLASWPLNRSAELSRAARRALRRPGSRAGALRGH